MDLHLNTDLEATSTFDFEMELKQKFNSNWLKFRVHNSGEFTAPAISHSAWFLENLKPFDTLTRILKHTPYMFPPPFSSFLRETEAMASLSFACAGLCRSEIVPPVSPCTVTTPLYSVGYLMGCANESYKYLSLG